MSSYSSSRASASASAGGVGFFGLLFIALLVLKLTHVINWSWWWITAPLWGGIALGVGIVVIWLLFVCVAALFEK
jgi:hypothetical protein